MAEKSRGRLCRTLDALSLELGVVPGLLRLERENTTGGTTARHLTHQWMTARALAGCQQRNIATDRAEQSATLGRPPFSRPFYGPKNWAEKRSRFSPNPKNPSSPHGAHIVARHRQTQ